MIQLKWQGFDFHKYPYSLYLVGQNEVTLQKGQNLIVSVQSPNTQMSAIGQHFFGSLRTLPYIEYDVEHYHIYTHITNPWYAWYGGVSQQVITGGGDDEYSYGNDMDPIVFNFQAAKSGTQIITIFVDTRGTGYNIVGEPYNNVLLYRVSFEIKVTVK